jgi:hypothetical protein
MNSEILEKITELAKMPDFTQSNIARILGIDIELLRKPGPEKDAYDTGVLSGKLELNKKIIQLSVQGSGPAQSLANKLFKQKEIQEMREYYG